MPTDVTLDLPPRTTPVSFAQSQFLLLTLIFFVISGLGSVFVILYLRPELDNTVILGLLFAFLTLTVTGMLALITKKMDIATDTVEATRHLVNGRMTELLAKTDQLAGLVGRDKALEEVAQRETDRLLHLEEEVAATRRLILEMRHAIELLDETTKRAQHPPVPRETT